MGDAIRKFPEERVTGPALNVEHMFLHEMNRAENVVL